MPLVQLTDETAALLGIERTRGSADREGDGWYDQEKVAEALLAFGPFGSNCPQGPSSESRKLLATAAVLYDRAPTTRPEDLTARAIAAAGDIDPAAEDLKDCIPVGDVGDDIPDTGRPKERLAWLLAHLLAMLAARRAGG
jgi:hypothetical protein